MRSSTGLQIELPCEEGIFLRSLLIDFNGTLALDGHVFPETRERIENISEFLQIIVLTGDIFGTANAELRHWPVEVVKVKDGREKQARVLQLGGTQTAAVGNGCNDVLMLKAARLGIAVLGPEGLKPEALLAADILVRDVNEALDLFLCPKRITATLRK